MMFYKARKCFAGDFAPLDDQTVVSLTASANIAYVIEILSASPGAVFHIRTHFSTSESGTATVFGQTWADTGFPPMVNCSECLTGGQPCPDFAEGWIQFGISRIAPDANGEWTFLSKTFTGLCGPFWIARVELATAPPMAPAFLWLGSVISDPIPLACGAELPPVGSFPLIHQFVQDLHPPCSSPPSGIQAISVSLPDTLTVSH